jgi:hypothetical protein
MTTIAYHNYTNIPFMSGTYASAPVIGPISTSRYPGTTVQNQLGNLSGRFPNPPQFYPSDGATTFSIGRAQYRRTNTTQNNFERGTTAYAPLRPTTIYSGDLQKKFAVSQTTKYNAPACSSLYMAAKKSAAIGQSSMKQSLPITSELTYRSYNKNDVKIALRRARAAGCIAPAKKGSIYNHTTCTGRICAYGSIVSSTY